jgi:hypothetical protein
MDLGDHVRFEEQRITAALQYRQSQERAAAAWTGYLQASAAQTQLLSAQFVQMAGQLRVPGLVVALPGRMLAPWQRRLPLFPEWYWSTPRYGSQLGELREGTSTGECAWIFGEIKGMKLAVLAGVYSPRLAFGEFSYNDPCRQKFADHHFRDEKLDSIHISSLTIGSPYFLYKREVSVDEYGEPHCQPGKAPESSPPVMSGVDCGGRDSLGSWEFSIGEAMAKAVAQMRTGDYLDMRNIASARKLFPY